MQEIEGLHLWKGLICAGNSCFDEGQTLSALAHYHQAIRQAEMLVDECENTREVVAALVVSYHNLADLYLRDGHVNLADHSLCIVHQKLSDALHQSAPHSLELPALLWGVSRTYFALTKHRNNYANQMVSQRVDKPDLFKTTFKNILN